MVNARRRPAPVGKGEREALLPQLVMARRQARGRRRDG